MRLLWQFLYFTVYLTFENVDPDVSMLRTDDYRGRYRRYWYEVFDFSKFTPHS